MNALYLALLAALLAIIGVPFAWVIYSILAVFAAMAAVVLVCGTEDFIKAARINLLR